MESLIALAQSFAQLLTPVFRLLVWLWPLKIYRLHDGERGVIISFGRVRRRRAERGPGITLVFCCEELIYEHAQGRDVPVPDQELSLLDGRIINVSVTLVVALKNIQKSCLELDDCDSFAAGMFQDRLRQYARTVCWREFTDSEVTMRAVATTVNKRMAHRGVYVQEALLTDCRIDSTQMICDVVREAIIAYTAKKEEYDGQEKEKNVIGGGKGGP